MPFMFQKTFIRYLVFFSFFLFLFLRVEPDFGRVESGIYYDYTESIVKDSDFNIVNQFFDLDEKKYVTSSYYYPDFHSHGSAIYLSYVYRAAELIASFRDIEPTESYFHVALTASTVFFFMLGMVLLPKTMSIFNMSFSKAFYFFLPLATPLFYYTAIEPGSGSVMAFALVQIFLIYYARMLSGPKKSILFALGVFMGLCFITKVDTGFYVLVPLHLFYYFRGRFSFRQRLMYLLAFFVGFSFINIFQVMNDYLKYNFLTYGYLDTVFTDYNLVFDVLFSPLHGIIYYSPIYLLAVIGVIIFLVSIVKSRSLIKEDDLLAFFILVLFLIKLLVFSGSYSHGSGVFGGRQFICDIPVALIFISRALELLGKSLSKFILIICVFFSLVVMFNYTEISTQGLGHTPWNVDASYYIGNTIKNFQEFLIFLWEIPFDLNSIHFKLSLFMPLVLVLFGIMIVFTQTIKSHSSFVGIMSWSALFGATYIFQTFANFYYGPINTLGLKKAGFFENALVGEGKHYYFYYENIGSLNERLVYLKARGEISQYQSLLSIRRQYHEKALKEIIFNPDENVPLKSYYKELSGEHHLNRSMKKYSIPQL